MKLANIAQTIDGIDQFNYMVLSTCMAPFRVKDVKAFRDSVSQWPQVTVEEIDEEVTTDAKIFLNCGTLDSFEKMPKNSGLMWPVADGYFDPKFLQTIQDHLVSGQRCTLMQVVDAPDVGESLIMATVKSEGTIKQMGLTDILDQLD